MYKEENFRAQGPLAICSKTSDLASLLSFYYAVQENPGWNDDEIISERVERLVDYNLNTCVCFVVWLGHPLIAIPYSSLTVTRAFQLASANLQPDHRPLIKHTNSLVCPRLCYTPLIQEQKGSQQRKKYGSLKDIEVEQGGEEASQPFESFIEKKQREEFLVFFFVGDTSQRVWKFYKGTRNIQTSGIPLLRYTVC